MCGKRTGIWGGRRSDPEALQDLGRLALPALPALEGYPDDENARNAIRTIKTEAGVR